MCDCTETMNAELAKHNTKLSEAIVFAQPRGYTSLMLTTEIIEKKRGAKAMHVFPTFCPFCGVKYTKPA